jgi:hypothetical protein
LETGIIEYCHGEKEKNKIENAIFPDLCLEAYSDHDPGRALSS